MNIVRPGIENVSSIGGNEFPSERTRVCMWKKYEGLKRIKYGPSKQSIRQSEEDMSPKEEYMLLSKGKFPKNEKKIMFFFVKTVVSSAEEFAIKWKKNKSLCEESVSSKWANEQLENILSLFKLCDPYEETNIYLQKCACNDSDLINYLVCVYKYK